MALVHSLWTAPMLAKQRGVQTQQQIESTIWCYASSVAYARRNGECINLYTDHFGRELLGFLPYNRIYNLGMPDNYPTEFWAAGKFFALEQMQLGDIHIDGDVFLKTPELMDMIHGSLAESDLIVQSLENEWTYDNEYYINCLNVIRDNNITLPNNPDYYSPAWNCGLVGFNNDELKHKYIQHYAYSVEAIISSESAMKQIRSNNETWMDLLIEQQHLYYLSKDYVVCNLLGSGDEAYENSRELGYQHLLGTDKWEQLDQIKKQLYYLDREIYYLTLKQIQSCKIVQ